MSGRDLGFYLLACFACVLALAGLARWVEGPPPPDQQILIEEADGVAVHPAAAAAGTSEAPPLRQVLALCRATYFSDDPEPARRAFARLSDDDKASVAMVCLAYRQGAEDMLSAIDAARRNGADQ